MEPQGSLQCSHHSETKLNPEPHEFSLSAYTATPTHNRARCRTEDIMIFYHCPQEPSTNM